MPGLTTSTNAAAPGARARGRRRRVASRSPEQRRPPPAGRGVARGARVELGGARRREPRGARAVDDRELCSAIAAAIVLPALPPRRAASVRVAAQRGGVVAERGGDRDARLAGDGLEHGRHACQRDAPSSKTAKGGPSSCPSSQKIRASSNRSTGWSPRPVFKLSMGADNSKSAGCNWFGAGSTPRPECKQIKSRIALSGDEACATALDSKRISHREFFQAAPETTSSAAATVRRQNAPPCSTKAHEPPSRVPGFRTKRGGNDLFRLIGGRPSGRRVSRVPLEKATAAEGAKTRSVQAGPTLRSRIVQSRAPGNRKNREVAHRKIHVRASSGRRAAEKNATDKVSQALKTLLLLRDVEHAHARTMNASWPALALERPDLAAEVSAARATSHRKYARKAIRTSTDERIGSSSLRANGDLPSMSAMVNHGSASPSRMLNRCSEPSKRATAMSHPARARRPRRRRARVFDVAEVPRRDEDAAGRQRRDAGTRRRARREVDHHERERADPAIASS